MKRKFVITGIGVVSSVGIGKEEFWNALKEGRQGVKEIEYPELKELKVRKAYQVSDLEPAKFLGHKGLRNLDKPTKLLLISAKLALEDANLEITEKNTDCVGVVTGTTLGSIPSITEFNKEVLLEGIEFSNPALFPNTVINAPSSQISIRFGIQGFNTTISTGFTSSLDALKYALDFLELEKAQQILVGAVESLDFSIYFGFYKLGYLAGIRGPEIMCPFDRRRNGVILGEGAVSLILETESEAKKRKAKIYAEVKSCVQFFDGFRLGKIHPQGEGLERAIKKAVEISGLDLKDFDYVNCSANSTKDLDKIELNVLEKTFGKRLLKKIPITSIKSMIGETYSASGAFQIASCVGSFVKGFIPRTLNYKEKDPQLPEVNIVTDDMIKSKINNILISCFGPGGYNSACVISRYS